MTTFQRTLRTFELGEKDLAYVLFLNDENSNDGITYDTFCNFMQNTLDKKTKETVNNYSKYDA